MLKKIFPLKKQASQNLASAVLSVTTAFNKEWQLDEVRIHFSQAVTETVSITTDDIATPINDANYLGAWDAETTYEVGDIVINGGVYYECIAESTNDEPPDTDYWAVWTYDTVLKSEDLTGATDFIWQPGQRVLLTEGDEIKVTCTNNGTAGVAYITIVGHEV